MNITKNVMIPLMVAWLSLIPGAHAATFKGEAELGILIVSGNSESETMNGKISLIREYDKWRHTGKLEGTNTSSSNVRSAERYFASYKADYKFREFDYLFGNLTYEDDRFSGYDYRATETIGYGRNIIRQDTLKLDGEIGVGARQSETDAGKKDSEGIVRGSGKLLWSISDTSTFGEEIIVEAGDDTTISKSITSLKSQINGSLAMKLSFTAKHTSDVPPGVEKTDTETAVNLVYGFN